MLGVLGVTWLSVFSGLKEILAIEAINSLLHIPTNRTGLAAVIIAFLFSLMVAIYTWHRGSR